MEIYSTEEQQAEAIKSFFRENGIALAIGVVLGLGGLYGWKAYNEHQITTAETASDSYSQLVEKAAQQDDSFAAAADEFINNNSESNYAVLAAFVAAKQAVEAQDLDKATEKLTWVTQNTDNTEFEAIAYTRLARIALEQKNYDAALAALSHEMPEAYKSMTAEVKGDVYLAKGDNEQARAAYQIAVDAGGALDNPLLQVKLDNLAVGSLNLPSAN